MWQKDQIFPLVFNIEVYYLQAFSAGYFSWHGCSQCLWIETWCWSSCLHFHILSLLLCLPLHWAEKNRENWMKTSSKQILFKTKLVVYCNKPEWFKSGTNRKHLSRCQHKGLGIGDLFTSYCRVLGCWGSDLYFTHFEWNFISEVRHKTPTAYAAFLCKSVKVLTCFEKATLILFLISVMFTSRVYPGGGSVLSVTPLSHSLRIL